MIGIQTLKKYLLQTQVTRILGIYSVQLFEVVRLRCASHAMAQDPVLTEMCDEVSDVAYIGNRHVYVILARTSSKLERKDSTVPNATGVNIYRCSKAKQ